MASNTSVTLAAVTGAHGVAGEVRLKLFGEGIDALSQLKVFNEGSLTLKKLRPDNKGGAVAKFAEINDRSAAEALRGTVLEVPRSALPPLKDDEYYHADLIGLPVISDAGEAIGRVHGIENFGATDILEIEKYDGKRFMVPFTEQAVPRWGAEAVILNRDFAE